MSLELRKDFLHFKVQKTNLNLKHKTVDNTIIDWY